MDDALDWPEGEGLVVWVNCATSLDGRLAFAGGARARLSSPEDIVRVQRIRSGADAVLVGVGTVVQDDPSLRVHWELIGSVAGREPTRIIVDGSGRTPETARVLDRSAPTIVATSDRSHRAFPSHVRTIVAGADRVDLAALFARLPALGIRRLLVEGGSEILASVLRGGLFDRLTVYTAPVVIGGATAPAMIGGGGSRGPGDLVSVRLVGLSRYGDGYVASYLPRAARAPTPGGSGPERLRADR